MGEEMITALTVILGGAGGAYVWFLIRYWPVLDDPEYFNREELDHRSHVAWAHELVHGARAVSVTAPCDDCGAEVGEICAPDCNAAAVQASLDEDIRRMQEEARKAAYTPRNEISDRWYPR